MWGRTRATLWAGLESYQGGGRDERAPSPSTTRPFAPHRRDRGGQLLPLRHGARRWSERPSPGRDRDRPNRRRSRTHRARRCAPCWSRRASGGAGRPTRPAQSRARAAPARRRCGRSRRRPRCASMRVDRLRLQDAGAIERAARRDRGIEAGHVAGGGDAAGPRHHHAVERRILHGAEHIPSPGVGAVRGVELRRTRCSSLGRKSDVGIGQAERAGDLGAQVVGVGATVEAADQLGADPMLGQKVVGAGRARLVLQAASPRRPAPPRPSLPSGPAAASGASWGSRPGERGCGEPGRGPCRSGANAGQ